MTVDDENSAKWRDAVLSVLDGASTSGDEGSLKVKKLRKMVLLSLQLEIDDKPSKKRFKRTVEALESNGALTLDVDGIVKLTSKEKRKHKYNEKKASRKKRKKQKEASSQEDNENDNSVDDSFSTDAKPQHSSPDGDDNDEISAPSPAETKNKGCKGNPQGVTRLFLGNLPFAVDEASLEEFLPGVTHIKWITDKETGKFYGSAFVEMDNSVSSAKAVAKAGSQLMGRPIKINFAEARPGDVWPPAKKVVSGGGRQAGGSGVKAMSVKPDNCMKLFIGNLSYDIDDDKIKAFFANVDAEVKAVRWLHHKDSGDFKGVGFVEFWNTEACERAATLNGKNLLERPIRIDWTD